MTSPSSPPRVQLGDDLAELIARLPPSEARLLVGISGAPGAGKSTLANAIVAALEDAVVAPMDGFHLADVELDRRRLRDRKGAPETFDAWGFAALLGRIRSERDHTVMLPSFERGLEQPIAGAIPVPPDCQVVVAEGNYLLLDAPAWRAARAELDLVWHVEAPDGPRRERLVDRHVRFGKSRPEAQAWVTLVDEPNARVVNAAAHHADLIVDLSEWTGA